MKKPDDESPDLEDLWTVNSMLVAWMFNTIEPTLRSTITHMKNTKDLWDDIKQHFSIGNGPRVQQLKADLADCKQIGQSIVSYCGRLKMLWDELANYDQIPTCICSAYGTLRSNVLSTEPFPPLNRVYAMTIQEERIQDATQVKDERDSVRFVSGGVIDLRRPKRELEKGREDRLELEHYVKIQWNVLVNHLN
ncbi:retrovirus-related pol polyprotein from transposon TNT 1-94 [Tanacetum coccineum]